MILSASCLSVLVASVIATSQPAPHDIPGRRPPALAPFHTLQAEHQDKAIKNSYIVVLKDDLSTAAVDNHLNVLQAIHEDDPLIADGSVGISQVYNSYLTGYSGRFTDAVVQRIREMPEVSFVEQDSIVHALETQDSIVHALETQDSAPWGLARISHRKKIVNDANPVYEYDPTGGEGVDAYIIGTGIKINHTKFEGCGSWGITTRTGDVDEDENGHGTHCAGIVGSRKYGVAKSVNLIAVKVLGPDAAGTASDVIAGVLWSAEQAAAKLAAAKAEYAASGRTNHKGSITDMPINGGVSLAMDAAVNRAVDSGLLIAVGAGNNGDACHYSPARAEKVVTAGASNILDEMSAWSSWGECVDVFAPGQDIPSTYIGSDTANVTWSGTSSSSAYTAGLLAYFLSIYPSESFNPDVSVFPPHPVIQSVPQRAFGAIFSFTRAALPSWMSPVLPPPALETVIPTSLPTLTPAQLKKALIELATPNALTKMRGLKTPNLLIFNNATDS